MSELDQYDYDLPRDLVAQEPLPHRADARLLLVDRAAGELAHSHVRDLPELLRAGDCLVLNDTRVVPARLEGFRTNTRGYWQGLFLEADADRHWHLLGKTRGHLAVGERVTLLNVHSDEDVQLEMLAQQSDGSWVARPLSDQETFALLDRVGRVPLPPYIRKGEMLESDRQNYQTVFARNPGAVAAPTAGLHFTGRLLEQVQARGVHLCMLTLHVGAGTFRPVTTERLQDHPMHEEWGQLTSQAVAQIQACRAAGGRVVAVGTTAVRLLESAAAGGQLQPFSGQTNLFIRPPYEFRAIDAMLTNFHLPKTTLLVLVRTFGGDGLIRRAYEEAIRERYRFYSYGDAMLIV